MSKDSKKTIFLIRGLPGSGKNAMGDRIVDHYLDDTELCVVQSESNHFFYDENGVFSYNPELLREAHKYCQETVRDAMRRGHEVVVTNTFVKKWELRPYKHLAKTFGYQVVVLVARGCKQSELGVPSKTISKMRREWEE